MGKNYLLFMPSLMRDKPETFSYVAKDRDNYLFPACQTNIPATEYVIELLNEKNEKIDKIIMFCSEEVRRRNKYRFTRHR